MASGRANQGEPLHDDEPDTSEAVARALLRAALPELANGRLHEVGQAGTSHRMWRIDKADGGTLVLRLPRHRNTAAAVHREATVLRRLGRVDLGVEIPTVQHEGAPQVEHPNPWLVLDWLDGSDAWSCRSLVLEHEASIAEQLATVVARLRSADTDGWPPRRADRRGGDFALVLTELDRWLDDPVWDAAALLDVAALRREADAARELLDEAFRPVLSHGDLLPGNLLLSGATLTGVLDWGGTALADPAQDLAPAWSVFGPVGRAVLRDVLASDDATWARGRVIELVHAVGAVLYYRPRRHPLAEVMQRGLDRILNDR